MNFLRTVEKGTDPGIRERIFSLPPELHPGIFLQSEYLSVFILHLTIINLEEISPLGLDDSLPDKMSVIYSSVFERYMSRVRLYHLPFNKLAMETLFRLNLKELLEKSMDEGYSKDVTIAAAHYLRSFYWKIGTQDKQEQNYWVIRTNQPRYKLITMARRRTPPIGTRSFSFDYYLKKSLASKSDANNQFAFTIWRNQDKNVVNDFESPSGLQQWSHTFWQCENKETPYSKLIRGMVRTCLVREVDQISSKFLIAQKGSKIGFFVQNGNSAYTLSYIDEEVTTLTPEDILERERGETVPIGMHWNRFIPFHPFAQNGTDTISDSIMLLPDDSIDFFRKEKVDFFKLPESWIEENYYLPTTEPDVINMDPPVYCGVFWDLQDKRHYRYIHHIFKVISTSIPPNEIYCEKIVENTIREVFVASKNCYLNQDAPSFVGSSSFGSSFSIHNGFSFTHHSRGLNNGLLRITVPVSFAETTSSDRLTGLLE